MKTPMPAVTLNPVAIPEPEEWVREHQILAGFAHTLGVVKKLLSDADIHHAEGISYTPEGDLIIGKTARNLLRSTYGDDRWQYIKNYLTS
jgi:hypothetical protein